MVAPLEIHIVVTAQHVHDLVRSRSAVIDIAQHMQRVYGQALYDICYGTDKAVRRAGLDYGIEYRIDVLMLVVVVKRLVYKLFYDVGILWGQGLADFGAGILGGRDLKHPYHIDQIDLVPVRHVLLLLPGLYQFEFLLGIIDKCTEFFLLVLLELETEELVHLAPDDTGSVAENVLKRVVLSVQVSNKMLSTFRKIENCLQIDNLSTCRLYRRKTFR